MGAVRRECASGPVPDAPRAFPPSTLGRLEPPRLGGGPGPGSLLVPHRGPGARSGPARPLGGGPPPRAREPLGPTVDPECGSELVRARGWPLPSPAGGPVRPSRAVGELAGIRRDFRGTAPRPIRRASRAGRGPASRSRHGEWRALTLPAPTTTGRDTAIARSADEVGGVAHRPRRVPPLAPGAESRAPVPPVRPSGVGGPPRPASVVRRRMDVRRPCDREGARAIVAGEVAGPFLGTPPTPRGGVGGPTGATRERRRPLGRRAPPPRRTASVASAPLSNHRRPWYTQRLARPMLPATPP